MDKEVFLRQEELRHQFKRHAKISSDVTACVATIGVWGSIAATCAVLGGPSEAPMTAGVITTLLIWVLRKMEQ